MKSLFFVAVILFSLVSQAGDHEIGNGGGLAEKTVLLAYMNLQSYLKVCTLSKSCLVTERELNILNAIYLNLHREYRAKNQIQFKSEHENPGFFFIDGQVRVARTGFDVGSTIYVNTDLLYWRQDSGEVTSVSLPMAVAILVHELGHHYGVLDHHELDVLSTKVQIALLTNGVSTKMVAMIGGREARFEATSYQIKNSGPSLIVSTATAALDLSDDFPQGLCQKQQRPIQINVNNISFPYYDYVWKRIDKDIFEMELDVYVKYYCVSEIVFKADPDAKKVRIKFSYNPKSGELLKNTR